MFSVKWLVIVLVVVSIVAAGCATTNKYTEKLLGDKAQTITVGGKGLDDKIETQWGSFKFTDKQINAIKELKQKGEKHFNVETTGKKGAKLKVVVTLVSENKYQLVCVNTDL